MPTDRQTKASLSKVKDACLLSHPEGRTPALPSHLLCVVEPVVASVWSAESTASPGLCSSGSLAGVQLGESERASDPHEPGLAPHT